MANDFGLTPDGFKIRRYNDIFEDYSSRLLQAYPSADLSAPSVFGTYGAILALGFSELYEVAQSISNTYDPLNASGIQLDQIGFFKNLFRNDGETDLEFRQRIFAVALTRFTSNSQEEKICNGLKNISFVKDAKIIVNSDEDILPDGTPINSYTPIIYVDQEGELTEPQKLRISRVLLANHPMGRKMYVPENDDGYNQYSIKDDCGSCKIVKWATATKIKAAMNITFRSYVGCNPCSISEPSVYAATISDYLNGLDSSCSSINPKISVSSIYESFAGNAPLEILAYKYKLYDPNVNDCSLPLFTSQQNIELDVQAELLNLQKSNILPTQTGFNTRFAYLEWDADCFTTQIK